MMFESQEGLMLSRYNVICAEYPCTSLVWHTVCSGFVRPSPIIWLGTFSLSVCLWLQLKHSFLILTLQYFPSICLIFHTLSPVFGLLFFFFFCPFRSTTKTNVRKRLSSAGKVLWLLQNLEPT